MRRIRAVKARVVFGLDLAAAVLAWAIAYGLRYDFSFSSPVLNSLLQTLGWAVPAQILVFWKIGLYRDIWRHASLQDLQYLLRAMIIVAVLVPLLALALPAAHGLSLSIIIQDTLLLAVLAGLVRVACRTLEDRQPQAPMPIGQPMLVLGAGDAGTMLVKALAHHPDWRVVGLLDDQSAYRDRDIHGVRVLGTLDELAAWVEATGAAHVAIAMPSASHAQRRRALDICLTAGVETWTVPCFDDLVGGQADIVSLRPVEIEDLLARDPMRLDDAGLHALLGGQVVMVTGAVGSVGAELCRQIARYRPEMLVFYEQNEYALYRMEQEFRAAWPQLRIACVIGDVRSEVRVTGVLNRYRPAVVFHAAAYKHVPLMEWGNVAEALATNVAGTCCLARACKAAGVGKMVMVSTDKAVNPANVVGASKRLAELVCQSEQEPLGTRFVSVRFGNVLNSSGSVLPKFRQQLAAGGPLTVTHPEVARTFLSAPEVCQLLLQAAVMGQGGEVFVINMGEPVRIADLARDMIRLAGHAPEAIRIVYTGLRPGEKLYEELQADEEHSLATAHDRLRIARVRSADAEWVDGLLRWIESAATMDEHAVKQELKLWVEEYVGEPGVAPSRPTVMPASVTLH